MQRLYLSATKFLPNEQGQSLVEYGLTLTLMVVAIVAGTALLTGLMGEEVQQTVDALSKL